MVVRIFMVALALLVTPGALASDRQCLDDYDRSLFTHWVDLDGNGLDERRDTIAAQVIAGTTIMQDLYTGQLLDLATETPDVDHVIPLRAAWDRGARCWDDDTRKQFANDRLNLVATTRSANRQKGARTIFDWIPPRLNRCAWYLDRSAAVAAKYQLRLTTEDLDAYAFLRPKCERWAHGVLLGDVRAWFGQVFGWRY